MLFKKAFTFEINFFFFKILFFSIGSVTVWCQNSDWILLQILKYCLGYYLLSVSTFYIVDKARPHQNVTSVLQFSKYCLRIKTSGKKPSLTLEYPRIIFFLTLILSYHIVQDCKICAMNTSSWVFETSFFFLFFFFSPRPPMDFHILWEEKESLKTERSTWACKTQHTVWLLQFAVCVWISFNHLFCASLRIYIQHMVTVTLLMQNTIEGTFPEITS